MLKKQEFKGLLKTVKDIIELLEEEGMIDILRQCPDMNSRYIKIEEIIPGLPDLETMPARQSYFFLDKTYKLV